MTLKVSSSPINHNLEIPFFLTLVLPSGHNDPKVHNDPSFCCDNFTQYKKHFLFTFALRGV